MTEDTGVWAYGITEEAQLSGPDGEMDLSWLTGVGETRVRTVTCSELAVLVSDVNLAEYGEAALRRNLEDLDWLDEVAREHHYVIDAAARLFPLLPTRLATVYTGDAAVCAALAGRRDQLRSALRRVEGRVEWGVKAYAAQEPDKSGPDKAEPDQSGRPASAAENYASGGDSGPGGGAGLAYLKRRRAQLNTARDSKAAAVTAAQGIHEGLAAKAVDTRLHPPQSAQLSGIRQPMLLNAAYLLDVADGPSFTASVAGQATAHPELRVELTGPWPPYSFAGDDHDEH
jgi:hypothetical protein